MKVRAVWGRKTLVLASDLALLAAKACLDVVSWGDVACEPSSTKDLISVPFVYLSDAGDNMETYKPQIGVEDAEMGMTKLSSELKNFRRTYLNHYISSRTYILRIPSLRTVY